MKVTTFALIAAVSSSAAMPFVSSSAVAQTFVKKLAVRATFDPNPPSAKGADKIIISVKDASGKPVSGATVKIATSMPTMSMKGADMVARDSGHGTYTVDAKLNCDQMGLRYYGKRSGPDRYDTCRERCKVTKSMRACREQRIVLVSFNFNRLAVVRCRSTSYEYVLCLIA